MSRADLDKQPPEVAAMFDRVASRYDLTNDVLALGRTRTWRRLVADALGVEPGMRVLDLAAGTGHQQRRVRRPRGAGSAVRLLARDAAGRSPASAPLAVRCG
ncbi:MAG: class I SAM-dependent methyltransferase [Candidatus Nanopelagicales bacterium]